MAQVVTNVAVAFATTNVGAYVPAGGAGSLTEVGHTSDATELSIAYNDYALKSEQSFGAMRKIPIDAEVGLKLPMMESTAENERITFRQAAAQKSGSAPNQTLLVGVISEQYHQLQMVTKGTGATTTATRTVTMWKGAPKQVDNISYTKKQFQNLGPTFDLLFDDTVATGDKFLKIVDSGGA